MNIHFGPFEDTAPGTDLCRIFCAGIGTLPLGVVLVMLFSRCALLSGREATHCWQPCFMNLIFAGNGINAALRVRVTGRVLSIVEGMKRRLQTWKSDQNKKPERSKTFSATS